MSWKDMLNIGVEYFRQRRYEEALEAFNRAICDNDKDVTLFDSRAAVLEKLDRPLDALKDSKRVIDLAPASWKGYARSARLFLQVGKVSAVLTMIELALARLKSADPKRRVELEALRDRATKAIELPPCYISRLPVELQVEIFSLVIDASNAKMLVLMLVCQSWRNIIVNTAKFWRHLVLTPKTTLKKADTWLQRSKGILSTLRISNGFPFADRPNVLRNASERLWSMLDTLDVSCNTEVVLPSGAYEQLRLRCLEIDAMPPLFDLRKTLRMDGSRLQVLILRVTGKVPLDNPSFTSLIHLDLRGSFANSELFTLLRRNQQLETLILSSAGTKKPNMSRVADRVELVKLRHLQLLFHEADVCIRSLRFPNLTVFRLTLASGCIEEILAQRPTCLEEVNLHGCTFSADLLIPLLQNLMALRILRLSACANWDIDDMNLVVEALAKPTSDGGNYTSPPIYCPKLQHVDLSASSSLKVGPIVRLVKAHMSSPTIFATDKTELMSTPDEDSIRPLPILSLNVDNCPLIDPDALPWLRATVPNFSCRMTPVKMGRGQR